jgi:hypothetical protein
MAEVREYTLKVDTDDAQKNVEDLNEEIKETGQDISGVEEIADKATGGMVSGFKGALKSVKGFIGGLKTMRGALIATGLGAFVLVVGSLAAAFTNSEEGQNKFTKLMNTIGIVTGNVVDILSDLGMGVMAAGKALLRLAKGDLKGAGAAWGEFKNRVSEATDGVKNFTEETKKEIKESQRVSDIRANISKQERQLLIDRAIADRDRADALEKAIDKEKFSVEERIGFLEDAGRIEEEITNKEIALAQARLDAKIKENSFSESTAEDLEEEAQLRADLINLETAKLTKQKEVTGQTIALRAEEAAALKGIDDQKIADQKILDEEAAEAEEKRLEDVKKAADEEIRIAQLVAEQKKQIQQANLNNISQGFALLGQIAGKNKALQAAAIIGESAVGIARTIIQTSASNAATIAQGSSLAIPTGGASVVAAAKLVAANKISAGISIAANVAATAKALGGLKAGGSPPTPPSLTTSSSTRPSVPQVGAPDFNIVGQTGASQIADAISGQNQQPFRAYVVAGDVTSGQSLERNIIEGASLGG